MGRKANWAARLWRAAAAGLRGLALRGVAQVAAYCCWAGLGRIDGLGNKRFEHVERIQTNGIQTLNLNLNSNN
jgi:hypothetical protein